MPDESTLPVLMAPRDLEGIHVLIVDDSDDSLDLLRLVFQYSGALVTTATTTKEAERLLSVLRPHVLVTDINMPDDGLTLIRAVRAMAETRGIRVPAIATTAAHARRAELLAEGFVEVVQKPLDPFTLCRTIRQHALGPDSEAADGG